MANVDPSGIEMSDKNGKPEADKEAEANVHYDGGFGPSIKVWENLKRTKRTQIAITAVVALIIGVVLGAGITAIIFTQTAPKNERLIIASSTAAQAPEQTTQYETKTKTVAQTTTTTEQTTQAERTTTMEPTPDKQLPENCDLYYESVCFHVVLSSGGLIVHLNESVRMCEEIGWKPANLYSREHYFMIEGYLRSMFGPTGYISAWTGMTMMPEDSQLVLSTGENVTLPDAQWLSGYPIKDEGFTHVGIDVLRLPTHSTVDTQGLWNYDPSWNGNAAICEKKI